MATPLWRDRRFVLLLGARVISVLGNGFARVALGFAVLALPDASAGRLSLVPACQAVPQLAFIPVGGVIADRMSRSRLMMLADVMGAGAYGALAALVLTGHAPLPALCLLAVAAGTANSLFAPAMEGLVPLLVPADRLQRANGLLRVGTNTSLLLGLGLYGVKTAWPRSRSPRRRARPSGCGSGGVRVPSRYSRTRTSRSFAVTPVRRCHASAKAVAVSWSAPTEAGVCPLSARWTARLSACPGVSGERPRARGGR